MGVFVAASVGHPSLTEVLSRHLAWAARNGRFFSNMDFDSTLYSITRKDPRYEPNAYLFAFRALHFTVHERLKIPKDTPRHVSARELVEGMRDCAITDFGPLARAVWESWGIHTTQDWGNVVYNLIDGQLMSANDEDSPDQFRNIYTFDSAFADVFNASQN